MKVLAIKSSPRIKGNTNSIIDKIVQGAEESGHVIIPYNLNEMHVKGCQACRTCKEKGVDCIIKDDLKDYWDKLKTADVLIMGSPVYMYTFCGPLKTFIDRHYCTKDKNMKSRLEPGKKVIMVYSQANSDEDAYKDNFNVLDQYFKTHKMEVQTIVHCGHNHASENEELMQMAYELGKSL